MPRATIAGEKILRSPSSAGPADEFVNLPGDPLLYRFRKRSRLAVRNHGAATLIAALVQHPHRRNVGENVIGVTRHPHVVPAILLLEPQRIIHHHLAAQDDPGDAGSELPYLHGI